MPLRSDFGVPSVSTAFILLPSFSAIPFAAVGSSLLKTGDLDKDVARRFFLFIIQTARPMAIAKSKMAATLMPATAPLLKEEEDPGWVSGVLLVVDSGARDSVDSGDEVEVVESVEAGVVDVADVLDVELELVLVTPSVAVVDGIKSTIVIVCCRSDTGAGALKVMFVDVEHS